MSHGKKSFKAIIESLDKRSEASGDAEFVADISSLKGQLMAMVGALALCSTSDDSLASMTADQALIRAGFSPNGVRLWLTAALDDRAAKLCPTGASPVAAH